jgi:hypothetical protein
MKVENLKQTFILLAILFLVRNLKTHFFYYYQFLFPKKREIPTEDIYIYISSAKWRKSATKK